MNSRRRRVRETVWRICAGALLCAAAGASAQTVYKQVDAAGRITFTDRPDTTPSRSPSPPTASVVALDVAKALASDTAMTSLYAATIDFNEAARRLRRARQSRQEGVERRPGEWTDSAGTTADQRYQRRQQKLEREVVAAELRAHETALIRRELSRRASKTDPLEPAQP
jgi:hypothetical protein